MIDSPASAGPGPVARVTSGAVAFGERLIRYATDWIDDRLYIDRHRQYIAELERSGELPGLLEAVGLTRDQLRMFELSPLASAELLSNMLERIGLGGIDIRSEASASEAPELRCRACGEWRQCRRWLEGGAQDDGYREFCPNAALLDRLRARQAPAED